MCVGVCGGRGSVYVENCSSIRGKCMLVYGYCNASLGGCLLWEGNGFLEKEERSLLGMWIALMS